MLEGNMKHYVAAFLLFFMPQVMALDLELTQGINSALPIGLNTFVGGEEGERFTQVINNDFQLSGQFRIIRPSSSYNGQDAPWTVLKQAGADSVLSGRVQSLGAGRYAVSFELIDAAARGRLLLSQSFQVTAAELRPLAHHIGDLVYEKLTGTRGVFSTKIAYVLVQRSEGRSRHSLEIADADGVNPRTLLISSEPIMSPTWSPDARYIAYVSFEKKKAQIFTVSVETGKRRLVTDFTGINGAPSWSPDGRQLALVLSKGGSPKIYTVDLSSGQMKQLTFGDAIDTEPRFSPDGRALLFTSGRGGNPQVYKLTLEDGRISRLTYEGNYNARASYTPDQKNIVMLHREDKQFNIATQDANGHLTPLTFSSFDESPTVAPNGRMILYATRYQDKGVLSLVSLDGRTHARLPSREGDVQEPAWSPFGDVTG